MGQQHKCSARVRWLWEKTAELNMEWNEWSEIRGMELTRIELIMCILERKREREREIEKARCQILWVDRSVLYVWSVFGSIVTLCVCSFVCPPSIDDAFYMNSYSVMTTIHADHRHNYTTVLTYMNFVVLKNDNSWYCSHFTVLIHI